MNTKKRLLLFEGNDKDPEIQLFQNSATSKTEQEIATK